MNADVTAVVPCFNYGTYLGRLAPGALRAMRDPLDRDPRLGFAYGTMRFFGAWEGLLRMPPYNPFKLLYRHTIGLTALARTKVMRDDREAYREIFRRRWAA